MNVRKTGDHIRAVREADRGDHRGAAIGRQVPHQVVHRNRTHDEREDDDEVVRGVRIAGRPVHRDGQNAGAKVRFGICERPGMRIEDVRVEEMQRVDHDRSRDPRDVPDAELTVAAVDAAETGGVPRQRIREERAQDDGGSDDQERFGESTSAGHSDCGGGPTVKFSSTPR